MSDQITNPTQTPETPDVPQSNAQQTNAERIATVVRGSGAGKSVTGDNRKTATKRTATKRTATPAKAVKTTRTATKTGPSRTTLNRTLGTALLKSCAQFAARTAITADMKSAGVTRDDIMNQVTQWIAYIPGDIDPSLVKFLNPATTYGGRRTEHLKKSAPRKSAKKSAA